MKLNEKYEFEPVKNYIHVEKIEQKGDDKTAFLPPDMSVDNSEYAQCKVLTPNKKCYTDPSGVQLKVGDIILVKSHLLEEFEGFVFVSESALVAKQRKREKNED